VRLAYSSAGSRRIEQRERGAVIARIVFDIVVISCCLPAVLNTTLLLLLMMMMMMMRCLSQMTLPLRCLAGCTACSLAGFPWPTDRKLDLQDADNSDDNNDTAAADTAASCGLGHRHTLTALLNSLLHWPGF